jgi:hypothetical protein
MKLRHPALIRFASFLGALAVKLYMKTVRYRYRFHGVVDPNEPNFRGRFIYAFWHEAILFVAGRKSKGKFRVLISQHADGELIAQVARYLGFQVARGSTTRGGAKALWEMLGHGESEHLAVTPDGPRGPRRQVQLGVIYLASRTGLPIVPIGTAYAGCWRARSWDRFAVPYPFTTAWGVNAPVVHVPPHLDREGLEEYRQLVEERMLAATAVAERLAAGAADSLPEGWHEQRPAA